jgi:GT2 family glycosyltransferase
LLIPTREREDLVAKAIKSLLQTTGYPHLEILILDNASRSHSALEYFKWIQASDGRVRVLPYHGEFNFSAINNAGVSQAQGEILGFINNDIEAVSEGWLEEMVSHAMRPDIGCVGAKLLYPNGTIQHGGVILGVGGVAGHSHKHFPGAHPGYFSRLMLTQNVSAVTAACLLVRKVVFEQVGGFDEENLAVAFNDVDICLKIREAGYRNLWTPHAQFLHHESISRGSEDNPQKIERFKRESNHMSGKWKAALAEDPYYNPNLTLDHEDFSLAMHSRVSL